MIKFDKETLIELAGLGAGAAGSAYVKQKLLTKADGTSVFGSGTYAPYLTDLSPVVIGLLLQGQKGFVKEAGKGMIAESVGSLIKKQIGLAGTGDAVLLSGTPDMGPATGDAVAPLMGYSDSMNDFNPYGSGESDY
jgi:hypothetical protein